MAILIRSEDFGTVWRELLGELLNTDSKASPRGLETREIMNATIEVSNGLRNVLVNPVRNLNFRFMIAEWLWIFAGLQDVSFLSDYNSKIKEFSDDGQILSGAYGKRLEYQWTYIFESLDKPDSRQAVASIWTPNPGNSKDIPCTISLQWLIREDKLHCTVNMRSSDIWLGLPYDFFTFSQLTNCVAGAIKVPVGSVTMNLASSHLYSTNYEDAIQTINSDFETIESPSIRDLESQPSKLNVIRMLKKDEWLTLNPLVTFPFDRYFEALKHNKTKALEVLRDISPK